MNVEAGVGMSVVLVSQFIYSVFHFVHISKVL